MSEQKQVNPLEQLDLSKLMAVAFDIANECKNDDPSQLLANPQHMMEKLQNNQGFKEILSSALPTPTESSLHRPYGAADPSWSTHDEEKPVIRKQQKLIEYQSDEEEDDENEEETVKPKTKHIHHTMNVKLKYLYQGKQKKIKYLRKTFQFNEKDKKNEISEEYNTIIIPIAPGSRSGDKITFTGEADRKPGYLPGDVIITLIEEDDETFERTGDNLLLLKNISLSEIYHIEQTITHLDNRKIKIQLNPEDVLTDPNMVGAIRKITGEGMPIKDTNEKGDLYIRFIVNFPEKLSTEDIKTLKSIIPPFGTTVCKAEGSDEEGTKEIPPDYTCVLEKLSQEDMDMLFGEMSDSYSYTSSSDDDEDEASEDDEDEEESSDESGDEVKDLKDLKDEVKDLKDLKDEVKDLKDEVKDLKDLKDEVKDLKDLKDEVKDEDKIIDEIVD